MCYRLEIFFTQAWYSYRALFRDAELKSYIVLKILQPIFQLLFFVLLAKYCMKTGDLTVRIIGNSFMLCQKNCIHGLGRSFSTERMSGTLKMVIAAPYGKFSAFFEKSFIHIWDAMISVAVGIIFGGFIFGLQLGELPITVLIAIALIAVFSCAGLGMVLGCLGVMSENMLIYNNFVAMFMLAFSGATFPITWLPEFLQKVSLCVPTSRSIRAVELLIGGADMRQVFPLISGEFLLGVFYILSGYFMIRYAEKAAIKNASVDLY